MLRRATLRGGATHGQMVFDRCLSLDIGAQAAIQGCGTIAGWPTRRLRRDCLVRLESRAGHAYYSRMDDTMHHADLAAGRMVPGDVVMRDLRDCLARLEAKAAARLAREDAAGP
jgi:hypothetical protein